MTSRATATKVDVVAQPLDLPADGQHREQRQRAHDDAGGSSAGPGAVAWAWCLWARSLTPAISSTDHVPDVLPSRPRTPPPACPDAAARQKSPASPESPVSAQQMLRDGQMAGAGDGQELRQRPE